MIVVDEGEIMPVMPINKRNLLLSDKFIVAQSSLDFEISDRNRVPWKISQGNRVEHSENQKWYFANAIFGFENALRFAFSNSRVGCQMAGFSPRDRVCNCAVRLKNENLRP